MNDYIEIRLEGGEPRLVDSPAEACAFAGIAERLPLTC